MSYRSWWNHGDGEIGEIKVELKGKITFLSPLRIGTVMWVPSLMA